MHTECSSVTGMQSATAVVLNRGCNPHTDTRTTLKIKNALREAVVASKSSEPSMWQNGVGCLRVICISR